MPAYGIPGYGFVADAQYVVVDQTHGHKFDIGEVITCVCDGGNQFTNGMSSWYLMPEEVVPAPPGLSTLVEDLTIDNINKFLEA